MPDTTHLAPAANALRSGGLAEKAKASAPATPAPSPAPAAQPTNASLPILGPVTQPITATFSPAPLRGAQLAAHNRKLNQAGIAPAKAGAPAKAAPPAPTPRPLGLDLVLRIRPAGKGMAVSFGFRHGGEDAPRDMIPLEDRALPSIAASSLPNGDGDLDPPAGVRFTATDATADDLAAAHPLMRRLNAALLNAFNETEDPSFPQAVLTLAGAVRAARIEVQQPDGSTATAKRGAAYIAAFKAWEAHRPKAG